MNAATTPRHRLGLAVALALALVLAAFALVPDGAGAAKGRNFVGVAKLRPAGDGTERGLVQITVKPKSAGIIAILIGLTVDPSDPSGNTAYQFRLSRRTCGGVRRNMRRPRFVTANLLGSAEYFEGGQSAFIGTDITGTRASRRWSRARSAVLLTGGGAANKFEIAACGRFSFVTDLIIDP